MKMHSRCTPARPTVRGVVLMALAALAASPALAAGGLTVVNFGGANGAAQQVAYIAPFEKATGTKVTMVEYNGEQARVKAMVEAKKVTWDVVEVEGPDLARGCDEGLYQPLDWSKIGDQSKYMKAAVHPCGVGAFVWSTVMAYDADRLKSPPQSWADFWDTKKYPGKRALRKGARYNLEFALMADGVKPDEVYRVLAAPGGADRAFNKLTELRPHIQWWDAGAQAPQFLVSGDVVLAAAFSGRIDAARREGRNLKEVWQGSIYDLDFFAIPTGTPNQAAAEGFIRTAVTPEAQAEYARNISYGPTHQGAMAMLDEPVRRLLPTAAENARVAVQFDATFWTDQGEQLEKRFAAWAAQ